MKTFKLLIGYDGSECADAALLDLKQAGLPDRVDAVVVDVADAFPFKRPKADPETARLIDKALEAARGAAAVLQRRFPRWTIRAEAQADDPGWGLIKLADRWKPDLLVVGCRGQSALRRMVLGSVSQKILTHARCSVRIARPAFPRRARAPRLVIGFDGSANARLSVFEVADRRWPRGTTVRLVTAVDERIGLLMNLALANRKDRPNRRALRQHWVQSMMQPAIEDLRAAKLNVTAKLIDGDPRTVLVNEARRWKADTLFVGARGLVAVERVLLGSTSTYATAHAACSVEVVR